MTNEQIKAKELAELLNAFAEGKQFEFKSVNKWKTFSDVSISAICTHYNCLRIKPETKRIPLTMQDLIDRELRKDTMRVKFNGTSMLITDFNDTGAWISGEKHEYEAFMFCYTFLDGTPCYKEVENE